MTLRTTLLEHNKIQETESLEIKAAKKTTEMRREVSLALDELDQHFEDIETYAMLFKDDQNIARASVSLLASMFKAIENVIGYLIRNKGKARSSAGPLALGLSHNVDVGRISHQSLRCCIQRGRVSTFTELEPRAYKDQRPSLTPAGENLQHVAESSDTARDNE